MIVDELIALLGFETKGEENLKRFRDGIESAHRDFEDFANKVNDLSSKVALGLAAIGTAASVALVGAFKFASSQAGDLASLGDISDRLGVGVEKLQELRHAAEMRGMDTGAFDNSLRRFVRRSAEAAQGGGAAKDAFKELGIQLKDNAGNLKDSDVLLGEVASKLQNVENQADKLRLSFKFFDVDGAKMVKVLGEGAEGLEKLAEDARQRGLIFSQEDIDRASAYTDEMTLFQKSLAAIRTAIALDMMPALTRMLSGLNAWYVTNRQIINQRVGHIIRNGMQALDFIWTDVAPRMVDAARNIDDAIRSIIRSVSGGKIDLKDWWGLAGVALALIARFFPLTVLASALGIAIDELATYMKGGETVIGPFFDAISNGWDRIKGFTPDFFREWVEQLEPLTAALTVLAGLVFLGPALKMMAGLFAISSGLAAVVAAGAGIAALVIAIKELAELAGPKLEYLFGAERSNEFAQPSSGGIYGSGDAVDPRRPLHGGILKDAQIDNSAYADGVLDYILQLQNEEGLRNLKGNLAKMSSEAAVGAVLNDNSVSDDNRDQSTHVEVNVGGVHVQQAVQAPSAVGQAVGNAAANAAIPPARRLSGN